MAAKTETTTMIRSYVTKFKEKVDSELLEAMGKTSEAKECFFVNRKADVLAWASPIVKKTVVEFLTLCACAKQPPRKLFAVNFAQENTLEKIDPAKVEVANLLKRKNLNVTKLLGSIGNECRLVMAQCQSGDKANAKMEQYMVDLVERYRWHGACCGSLEQVSAKMQQLVGWFEFYKSLMEPLENEFFIVKNYELIMSIFFPKEESCSVALRAGLPLISSEGKERG